MPILGPDVPLGFRPARVLIGGTSGSGKSTLAQELSILTGLDYVELDALNHGPNWTVRPEFLSDVVAVSLSQQWVTDYQYADARPILLARADLVVYLLLPRRLVMWRIILRTIQRSLRRQVLWNGNTEPPLHTFFTDRDHIIRWAWRTHSKGPGRVEKIAAGHPDLPVVVLRSTREVQIWLEQVRQLLA